MTKQSTNLPQRSLRALIADDAYVTWFQTVGQYRAALLRHDATHPVVGTVTNDQIAAGAAVKCECSKPLGRNVAIDVHDAMERAQQAESGVLNEEDARLVARGMERWRAGVAARPACGVPPPGWYCTRAAGHDGARAAKLNGSQGEGK